MTPSPVLLVSFLLYLGPLYVVILVFYSVFWQLMALLLLRHALYVTSPDGEEDDVSTFFSVSNAIILCVVAFCLLHILLTGFFLAAFLASGCWFSSSMLHNGLGYQYIATAEAKTGWLLKLCFVF